ncbi:MAG TPA: hypothetical protein VNM37_22260 [Candidatus Dormibacteraeota bacterium]|nr:hypothetical protein [Candidatus Dormibacteraeota bacterium]
MEPFDLFVSCVEGYPVTRYGSRTFIGARRDPAKPNEIIWSPDQVVAIPRSEYTRHRREYDRAVKDGELRLRTEADWELQIMLEAEADQQNEARKAAAVEATAAVTPDKE